MNAICNAAIAKHLDGVVLAKMCRFITDLSEKKINPDNFENGKYPSPAEADAFVDELCRLLHTPTSADILEVILRPLLIAHQRGQRKA